MRNRLLSKAQALMIACGSLVLGNSALSAPENTVRRAVLKVPGANIYYEVQGSGPLLLLIPGGPADAGVFLSLAPHLAKRYTVVAYDPRGNSRSIFESESQPQKMDTHGDDAARLIRALGPQPAFVFGSSGGGQVALNLAARYPKLVRTVVVHEPPCISLLDDPTVPLAQSREVAEIYHQQGALAAMQRFMMLNGMGVGPPSTEPDPAGAATMARIQKNLDYFFLQGHVAATYVPEVKNLLENRTRIVVGVGAETKGQTANRTGLALASKLGIEPVIFPGDHVGFGPHAAAFAETLLKALE